MHTPGAPTAFQTQLNADLSNALFQVTPENLIQVHHALAAEAALILSEVDKARIDGHVGVAAKDPVSQPAAKKFNDKITQQLNQCQQYGQALQKAADQLRDHAANYGHTEDEVKQSFKPYLTDYLQKHTPTEGPHR